ncbi:MAG TPA: adenosylmethionine decarboxylase [Dehalococcoidales bacterium]|nr:adenosylmethionine decarboxylase [Dehalococcoidales bacterium]
MNALGRHLLIELQDCNEEALNDLGYLRDAMLTAARECGAVVLGDSFHRFSPQGVSGVVVIAESHLSIHTWPEFGYAAVDVFTCGTTVRPEKAAEVLIEKLGARHHSQMEIPRGLLVTV